LVPEDKLKAVVMGQLAVGVLATLAIMLTIAGQVRAVKGGGGGAEPADSALRRRSFVERAVYVTHAVAGKRIAGCVCNAAGPVSIMLRKLFSPNSCASFFHLKYPLLPDMTIL
jgi:hypothetical protein